MIGRLRTKQVWTVLSNWVVRSAVCYPLGYGFLLAWNSMIAVLRTGAIPPTIFVDYLAWGILWAFLWAAQITLWLGEDEGDYWTPAKEFARKVYVKAPLSVVRIGTTFSVAAIVIGGIGFILLGVFGLLLFGVRQFG